MVAAEPATPEPRCPVYALVVTGETRAAITLAASLHGAAIGRLCMALLGSQSEAEEVVQETLVAAYRRFDQFRGDGSIRAWLMGIARRQCARYRERVRPRERELAVVPASPDSGPDTALERRRRARVVRDALARLGDDERDVLVLRYLGELSYREIAALCDIEESTARKRASRGAAHLRDLIDPEWL